MSPNGIAPIWTLFYAVLTVKINVPSEEYPSIEPAFFEKLKNTIIDS